MNKYKQYIYWALGIGAVGGICYYFSDILIWLIFAWVVSLLGSPIMNLLGRIPIGRRRLSATVRAALTLTIFFLIFVAFIALFVPVIIQQGNNLAKVNYAQVITSLETPINHLYGRLAKWGIVEEILVENRDSVQKQTQTVDSLDLAKDSSNNINIVLPLNPTTVNVQNIQIDSLIRASGDTIARTNIQLQIRIENDYLAKSKDTHDPFHDSTALVKPHDSPVERVQKQIFTYFNPSSMLRNTASTVWSLVGNLFILLTSVMFIAFFFLQEEGMFSRLVKAPFSEKHSNIIDRTLYLIKKMLIGYFEGILAQMAIITTYLWILLSLVGAENALLIAFFAAIVNVVPYLGPFIGMAFAVIVSICSNLDADFYIHTLPLLLRVIIVFFSMQAIDNLVLQPLIFSKSVKAHPVEIFVVIVVGSKLAGMVGMVVAIPAYTALRVIASIFLNEFKIVQHLTSQLGIKQHWVHGTRFVKLNPPPVSRYKSEDKWQKGEGWRTRKRGEN